MILSQYLSCQASKFVGVYLLKRHDFWFKIEQELHICGEGQEIAIAAYVVVAKLDEMLHAVFLGMFPNGGDAFGLCCFGFHLYRHTLALVADEEIQLHTGVFLKVVEALAFFDKRISHQILIDGSFETTQIALQNVGPCSTAQHRNEHSNVGGIDLDHIVYRVALQRQTGNFGVLASANDVGIFQPL